MSAEGCRVSGSEKGVSGLLHDSVPPCERLFLASLKVSFILFLFLSAQNDQSTGEIKVIGGDDLSTLTGKVKTASYNSTDMIKNIKGWFLPPCFFSNLKLLAVSMSRYLKEIYPHLSKAIVFM